MKMGRREAKKKLDRECSPRSRTGVEEDVKNGRKNIEEE